LYSGLVSKTNAESLLKELLRTNDPMTILLAGECLSGAQGTGLDLQKETIDAILQLPYDAPTSSSSANYYGRGYEILDSLDPRVILERARVLLHGANFFRLGFLVRNQSQRALATNDVVEAIGRILTGKQRRWKYSDSLSLIL